MAPVVVPDSARVLTHCNAGALATAGYGTALGVIRGAVEQGKKVAVLADETRPFLQGARLTAWELTRDGIDTTVITDNMSGALMRGGEIDLVVVGADRIAANGDVANKIGTYTVAVLAKEHGIPFYVAAPISTIDLATPDGSKIPIEERNAKEVTHLGPTRLTPEGATVRNPAFDVTPNKYVTAIITEQRHRARALRRVAVSAGQGGLTPHGLGWRGQTPFMLMLGIETSCDETSAAVVSETDGAWTIGSNIVASQVTSTASGAASCPSWPRDSTSATSAASSVRRSTPPRRI